MPRGDPARASRPQRPPGTWLSLEQTAKPDEAIASYREAIQIAPDNAQAHSMLAAALSRLGKHDEAIAASRDAVRLAPQDANAQLGLGYSLQEKGRLEESRREFSRGHPARAR